MIALQIATKTLKEVVDITERLQLAIQQNGLNDGIMVLFLPHTAAALTTAEIKPGMDQALLTAFETVVPAQAMPVVIDPTLTLPVKHGQLMLGTEQRVVLVEFDGPKDREVSVSFMTSVI
jgi:thiamine phosphate synthase YjbQ (UPF0047 family)